MWHSIVVYFQRLGWCSPALHPAELISQTIKQSAFPTKFPINSSEYISTLVLTGWVHNDYEFLSFSSRHYPGGIIIRIQFRRVQISICQLAHISMKLGRVHLWDALALQHLELPALVVWHSISASSFCCLFLVIFQQTWDFPNSLYSAADSHLSGQCLVHSAVCFW